MDKKAMLASTLSGLGGVVLGLLSARAIPQKVEVQLQAPQIVDSQSKFPHYFFVSQNLSSHYGVVVFKDNLAPGMKAFAEYSGKKIELQPYDKTQYYASFIIPEELRGANEFDVSAVDRDGNNSEVRKLFSLGGGLIDVDPNISFTQK